MVFKKLLAALGVGGPSVDTVLTSPNTRPGLNLEGQVHVRGGDHPVDIDYVTLSLVTRVEIESGDSEYDSTVEFHRLQVTGGFHLTPGQQQSFPFQFPVPWETPITELYGQHLHGMAMGLRTELSVARAVDKSDLDLVNVHPLPAQQRVLDALSQLDFRYKGADLEAGHIRGVAQSLPFYQEIGLYAAPQYAHAMNEVEVTFVTNPHAVDVILEVDKRGGLFTGGHDVFLHFQVPHADTATDWAGHIDHWLRTTVLSHAGHPGHYGSHGHHHGHGGMGAVGGAVAGAAAGFVGGMVAGEIIDDVFGDDEGAEED